MLATLTKFLDLTMALEELHRPLVSFRVLTRVERAQALVLAGLRVQLSRIEPELARLQLADHGALLFLAFHSSFPQRVCRLAQSPLLFVPSGPFRPFSSKHQKKSGNPPGGRRVAHQRGA